MTTIDFDWLLSIDPPCRQDPAKWAWIEKAFAPTGSLTFADARREGFSTEDLIWLASQLSRAKPSMRPNLILFLLEAKANRHENREDLADVLVRHFS